MTNNSLVRTLHLADGTNPNLDVILTITTTGDEGTVAIAYANGERLTLTYDMLTRINSAVKDSHSGKIDPQVLGRALADAAEARRQRVHHPTRGMFESTQQP